MERTLVTWEREIYGPRYDSGYWRVKMNPEIYNKFKALNIITVIKVRRYCNDLGEF